MINPYETVPGCKDFIWKEGFSAGYRSGKLVYRVDPIPDWYEDNALKVFRNLQIIRNHFKAPVFITNVGCMYRTFAYNLAAGGAIYSKHKKSLAADISVQGVPSMQVYAYARDNTEFRGFGIISQKSIHLDIRPKFWFKVY